MHPTWIAETVERVDRLRHARRRGGRVAVGETADLLLVHVLLLVGTC